MDERLSIVDLAQLFVQYQDQINCNVAVLQNQAHNYTLVTYRNTYFTMFYMQLLWCATYQRSSFSYIHT